MSTIPSPFPPVPASGGTFTGPVNITDAASAGGEFVVVNTFSAPSNHTVNFQTVNASDRCIGIGATGDANDRWNTTSAGFMQWGSGAGGLDTNLYRSAANTLKTDDSIVVTGSTTTGSAAVSGAAAGGLVTVTNTTTTTTPDLLFTENATTSLALGSKISTDTNPRWQVGADGKHTWGPGNGATDTDLYRASAGLLQSDNVFVASNGVRTGGNVVAGATSGIGDNGIGEIQLKDAQTVPTTNPVGGCALYSVSSTATPLKIRDTAGNVRSVVDGFFQLTTNPTFTSASQTATTVLLAVEASATYLMENAAIFNNSTGNTTFSWTGPTGATMQWNDTTASSDYTSTITGAGFTWGTGARMVIHKGILITSTTAGSLTLTVAVSAGTTTLNSGTYLRLTRVA